MWVIQTRVVVYVTHPHVSELIGTLKIGTYWHHIEKREFRVSFFETQSFPIFANPKQVLIGKNYTAREETLPGNKMGKKWKKIMG